MSKNVQLRALPRAELGKEGARKLRAAGRIPAVMYGKDMEPISLSLDRQEVEHLFDRIAVENTIIELRVEGEKGGVPTLIREVQTPPHKPGILHVDFLRIQKGVAVEVDIPVVLEGVPVGVKDFGGILEQHVNELRVKCIPSKIPEVVSLDVSKLELGEALRVSDIELGEGVDILVDGGRTVCSVQLPRAVAAEVEEAVEMVEEVAEEAASVPAEEAPAEPEESGSAEG